MIASERTAAIEAAIKEAIEKSEAAWKAVMVWRKVVSRKAWEMNSVGTIDAEALSVSLRKTAGEADWSMSIDDLLRWFREARDELRAWERALSKAQMAAGDQEKTTGGKDK